MQTAIAAVQRSVNTYTEMLSETLCKSYSEQHLECFDLYTWYILDRCDPDKFSKHYPGLLTENELLHRYGKFCLSRGFHCTQQSFRKVKDAALKFFSDGMANGKEDSDFEHGGGSFNQE